MCTMLEEMRSENWAGITSQLGDDINDMLRENNMDPGLCPQPPQQMSIVEHRIRMPAMPSILSFFADVSKFFPRGTQRRINSNSHPTARRLNHHHLFLHKKTIRFVGIKFSGSEFYERKLFHLAIICEKFSSLNESFG